MASHSKQYDLPTYEGDLAAWAFHQAMLLRSGQLHLLDRAWIAEELDSLGRQEFDKLESALRLVLLHILKWQFQPERRTRSWSTSITTHRRKIMKQFDQNPSLVPRREEAIAEAYQDAVSEASGETDLPANSFPAACPYSWYNIMARPYRLPDDGD